MEQALRLQLESELGRLPSQSRIRVPSNKSCLKHQFRKCGKYRLRAAKMALVLAPMLELGPHPSEADPVGRRLHFDRGEAG
jgi:hypothetical protein